MRSLIQGPSFFFQSIVLTKNCCLSVEGLDEDCLQTFMVKETASKLSGDYSGLEFNKILEHSSHNIASQLYNLRGLLEVIGKPSSV